MKRFNEIRDNGTVDFGDIYACDLKYDVIVEIYDKKRYKNIRYKWYQVHFLYLKATQIRGGYDYFYLTIDPDKLEDKKF